MILNKKTVKLLRASVILVLFAFCSICPVSGKTVTDEAGRTMEIPDNPDRIIAFAPSVTEIVYEIGQGSKLVGVTRYSDYPAEARQLPRVGSYIHLDLEKIVALKPDLCIGVKDGNTYSVVKRLELFEIPVYVINPKNLDTVMRSIENIGAALNQKEKSRMLTAGMKRRIKQVQKNLSGIQNRPGVFFQIGIKPIVSVGTSTFIHDLIITAGGKNLAMGNSPYPRFSREQVIGLKPDLIVISSMARDAMFETERSKWLQWPSLPAVRKNRIALVDSNLFDRPTTRLVTGLEILAHLIHPSLFPGPEN